MPFTIIGSFAVAASTDIYSLLFWRFVQTFGCSGGYALGAATIGDIYRVEERGTAMGTFLGVSLLAIMVCRGRYQRLSPRPHYLDSPLHHPSEVSRHPIVHCF